MTLTRRKNQQSMFAIGIMYDKDGNVIKDGMFKYEARLMFKGLEVADATDMGFIWIPDDKRQPHLTWDVVHG